MFIVFVLESSSSFDDRVPKNEKNLSCSYCRTDFIDLQGQREHYKLDWHRYNLKQSLLSKQPINEQEFNEKTNNGMWFLFFFFYRLNKINCFRRFVEYIRIRF